MKYIKLFDTTANMNAAIANSTVGFLGMADNNGNPVLRNVPTPETIQFYIDVRGAVTLEATSGLQMSTDGKTWTDTTATTLSSGKTYFRVATDQSSPLKPNWTEGNDSDYDIGGNINSLVKVNFENDTTCYTFYASDTGFFTSKTKLKSAGNLILPATTLVDSCYRNMFKDCTSLTTTPELPATTLAQSCYQYMFKGCTALTTAPALPATTLDYGCYGSMFQGCTSLTTAPALPATTVADSCYYQMFQDCTSLTTAPSLPATTAVQYCYDCMFKNCTSLTTAPELPATTLAQNCYSNMFYNCTALTTAPSILPATTLAQDCWYCYQKMFYGCTALTTAPSILSATTLAYRCYEDMFRGCTSLTTAPELPANKLADYCYRRMFQDCTHLNYIKCLATNISASGCLNDWVNGVAATGTFVKDANMTSWPTDSSGIPSGWTVEDATD